MTILGIILLGLGIILTVVAGVHWYKQTEFFFSKKCGAMLFFNLVCLSVGLVFMHI